MLKLRLIVKRLAFWLATCVFAITALAIDGQFFIAWAEEEGWFAPRMHLVIAYLGPITATSWFGWAGGSVVGFAFGPWLDALLWQIEQNVSSFIASEIDREALAQRAGEFAIIGELSKALVR